MHRKLSILQRWSRVLGRDGHTVEENLALALLSPLGEDAGSTVSACAGATCPLMQCPGGQGHFFPDISPALSVCVTAGTLLCSRSRLLGGQQLHGRAHKVAPTEGTKAGHDKWTVLLLCGASVAPAKGSGHFG